MSEDPTPPFDPDALRADFADFFADLARYRMPFGKFGPGRFPPNGIPLFDLPLEYLLWFRQTPRGFPAGRLGELMAQVCAIKSEGDDHLFDPLRQRRGRSQLRPPP